MLYQLKIIMCPVPPQKNYVLFFCQLHSNYWMLQNMILALKYFQWAIYELVHIVLSTSIDIQLDSQELLWFE